MKIRLAVPAALVGLLLQSLPHAFGQGALTPPGAPTPTMKSLAQVEARIIVNATNTPGDAANTFIISVPGSYYLTGNATGVLGKHGISIQASDVTLDLNGFALISGGTGAAPVRGVDVPAAQTGFSLRNGTVRGWSDGGVRTDLATSTFVEKLRLTDNTGATGLALGSGSGRDCVATGNANGFVLGNGAQLRDCAATANGIGFSSGDRAMASNCIATGNSGDGFNCTSYVMLIDCSSNRNGGSGIVVQGGSSIVRCSATRNLPSGNGIQTGGGCHLADCTVANNGNDGITIFSGTTVRNCTAQSNGGTGITAMGGADGCQIIGNTCQANLGAGIHLASFSMRNVVDGNICNSNAAAGVAAQGSNNLIIRNTASGNGSSTQFSIDAGNRRAQVLTPTSNGFVSTDPWANFTP